MAAQLEDIELRSEEVQDVLNKVPSWMIRWGNTMFLLLIVLGFAIMWLVRYPDIIKAEALLTTTVPPQEEYAKSTGRLSVILVTDNERVKAGQKLAVLENTANHEDVARLQTIVDTISVGTQSFYFPLENVPVLFLGEVETQYALFENAYLQYLLNKQLKPFSNEALASTYSIAELEERLSSMNAQREINEEELRIRGLNINRAQELFESGVIAAQEFEYQQLEHAQAVRSFKSLENSISQLKESINNAHKLARGMEINRIKEEMMLLRNVIQSFDQLKKALKDWEYRYVLKSNCDGYVAFNNVWSTNQTVNQGDRVFSIIPHNGVSVIARLKTPGWNAGKLKKGQTVYIKLENYPETEYGVLAGTVSNISLVPDHDGNYSIEVNLPEKLITTYGVEIEFKQEMRGSAEIVTEDLRLIERILYQFKDLFG